MWAVSLIGVGLVLPPVWNGAPALFPGAMARWGLSDHAFQRVRRRGIPWFQSHGQWGRPDYSAIAPGDAIFFDWDLDGRADHVASLSARMVAGSTPWRAIPATPAKSEAIL